MYFCCAPRSKVYLELMYFCCTPRSKVHLKLMYFCCAPRSKVYLELMYFCCTPRSKMCLLSSSLAHCLPTRLSLPSAFRILSYIRVARIVTESALPVMLPTIGTTTSVLLFFSHHLNEAITASCTHVENIESGDSVQNVQR